MLCLLGPTPALAGKLAYRSQRETPGDRALSSAFALRRKLGADGGVGRCDGFRPLMMVAVMSGTSQGST